MQQQSEKTNASIDRITESALAEIFESEKRQRIAALAYEFWQARGCPDGTPDEDWLRAEREIAGSKRIDEDEVGSRDSAERSIDAEQADSLMLRFPARSEVFQASQERPARRTASAASS
jgi:hypothetical protein